MTIDMPSAIQTDGLRQLWKEAFGDSDAFLDAFFATAFSPERCRCAAEQGKVVGALYWFDATHLGNPVAYLYAVATAGASRGRGICHALMEDTCRYLQKRGYAGTILVPGSEALFRFYEKMGYRVCSYIREFACDATPKAVALQPVDAKEYAARRRQLLPAGGVVQEGENLAFLGTQARLYAGEDLLLAATMQDGMLYAQEFLGDTALCPGILHTLGCARGKFRVPGNEKPFAMYRLLEENGQPAPSYFALAFD